MKTDKDCINREDGQLDDDSLASVWGGMESIRWAVSIYQYMNGSNNGPAARTSSFRGQVTGGGYGDGGSRSW